MDDVQKILPVKIMNTKLLPGMQENRTMTAPVVTTVYDPNGNEKQVITDGLQVLPAGEGVNGSSTITLPDYFGAGNSGNSMTMLQDTSVDPGLQTLAVLNAAANANQQTGGSSGTTPAVDKTKSGDGNEPGTKTPMLRVPLPEKLKMAMMQKELPFQVNAAPLNTMASNPLAGLAAGLGDIAFNMYGKGAMAPRGDNPISDMANQFMGVRDQNGNVLGGLNDLARYRALSAINSIERPMTTEEQMQMQLANNLKEAQAYRATGQAALKVANARIEGMKQIAIARMANANNMQDKEDAAKMLRQLQYEQWKLGTGSVPGSPTSIISQVPASQGKTMPTNLAGNGMQDQK